MLKAVKIRLYPNAEQQAIIDQQIGGNRYIYNRLLALRINAYKKFGKKVGKFDLIKRIAVLKKRENTSWLKEIDSQSLQQSVGNMDKAYKSFFKGGGFPKFKSRHHSHKSFQYPQRVKIEGKKVSLPKVGLVKMKGWRGEFQGAIKTVTVSLSAGQYHASILIESDCELCFVSNNKTIGLDVGVKLFLGDSDGIKVRPLDLVKELSKLRARARQLSRKKKGSNNRLKAKMRLAKQNLKIVNIRKDFLHKLSRQYSENQTVAVENLKIKNMTKSAKGTQETPGKNVSQKKGLNRVKTQQNWGMFYDFLEYKQKDRRHTLIKVSPHFTSQMCNECSHVSKLNRKTQSKFVCVSCGHSDNADVNVAKNIRDLGVQGSNASHQLEVAC